MRFAAAVVASLTALAVPASADVEPEHFELEAITGAPCDGCKVHTRVAIPGVGAATVYDAFAKDGRELEQVWLVLDTGGQKLAARVADYRGGGAGNHYDWAVGEAPSVRRFAYDVMEEGKPVSHVDLGLELVTSMRRSFDTGAKLVTTAYRQDVFVTCGSELSDDGPVWECSSATFGGPTQWDCDATGWDPKTAQPLVRFTCRGRLELLPR